MSNIKSIIGKAAYFIILVLYMLPGYAAAITDNQLKIYDSGIYYFDADVSSNGNASCSANLSGSDNEEKIWNYLTGPAGLNQVATAGIMGNISTESAGTWNPRINNGGDYTDWPKSNTIAYGLVQWLGGRQDNLVQAAHSQNVIAGDLGLQLNFINTELNGSYKNTVRDPIQSLKNGTVKDQVTQAAYIVYQSYEGPNDGSYPSREDNAWSVYTKYSTNQPVGIGGSTITDCPSSVSCNSGGETSANGAQAQLTSTDNSVILCEAQKYKGIYYQSGGGHGYATFRQACPEASIPTAASASTATDPGPCATDCSGLVSVAVDAVYNQNYNWTVSDSSGLMTGDGAENWKKLPSISDARPGDIVTKPGHVEIVQSINGNTVVTFGSHSPGVQTGTADTSADYWTSGAWRWTGTGAVQ